VTQPSRLVVSRIGSNNGDGVALCFWFNINEITNNIQVTIITIVRNIIAVAENRR
jgi:hypothetical protein